MQATREQTRSIGSRPTYLLSSLPWWAFILALAGVAIVLLVLSNQNYRETFLFLRWGMVTTLRITLISFPIATVIGLLTGLARLSKNVVIFTIATLYVEIIRGIPLVVLILMVAFAVVPLFVGFTNQIGEWGLTWAASGLLGNIFYSMAQFSIRSIPMEMRAIIALALGYGGFSSEIFRAGIQSISKGQTEAARSLGMSYLQAMRYVILPQAVRRVLPPLGNDFIAMLKDSSLATVLAVSELTQLTRLRRSSTFRVMEAFNVAAFLYLSMTLLLSAAVRVLEQRMKIEE